MERRSHAFPPLYTTAYVSNAQVEEYASAKHLVTVHCIISFQNLKKCHLVNNWALKVNFWHLTTNMENSI